MDRRLCFFSFFAILHCLLRLTGKLCHFCHNLLHGIVIARIGQAVIHQLQVRQIRRTPVGKSVADKAILPIILGIRQILLGRIIDQFQKGMVTRFQIIFIGQEEQRAIPSRAAAPVMTPTTGGCNTGKLTVSALAVYNIGKPLAVSLRHIKLADCIAGRNDRIACPAILFPVRAVLRNAVEITEEGADTGILNPIKQLTGGPERALLTQISMDKVGGKCIQCRGFFHAGQFYIAEAVVYKAGFPALHALSPECILIYRKFVRTQHITRNIALIQFLAIELFTVADGSRFPCLASHFQAYIAGAIFAKIKDPTLFRFPHICSRQALTFPHRRQKLRYQLTGRWAHYNGTIPIAVIIAFFLPAVLQTGIVILTGTQAIMNSCAI